MARDGDYVLGISAFSHDPAAALIRGGEIRCLIEEERLNRRKHCVGFPELAIQECLRLESIKPEQIGHVAFFKRPGLELWAAASHAVRYFPRSLNHFLGTHGGEPGKGGRSFLSRLKSLSGVGEPLRKALGVEIPLHFIEHHLAHASGVFYPSSFERSAVIVWDGRGEMACTTAWLGEAKSIRKLVQVGIPHSMGHFYNAITGYLGFSAFEDEWKVMGLSGHGKDSLVDRFRDTYVLLDDGTYRLNLSYFAHQHYGRRRLLSPRFFREFGPPRKPGEPLEQRHLDIAYAVQAAVQDIGLHFARSVRLRTGCENLCLSGGVSQNILLNSHVAERAGFREVLVQPVTTDAGAALGSALRVAHGLLGKERGQPLEHSYLGPDYREEEIEKALAKAGARYSRPQDLCRTVAESLHAGKVVGWFQGRMEAGPRALGNRSLLATPCQEGMRDRLNARVKRREGFRPFAPAVLEERAPEYFDGLIAQPSRFMASSARVRPDRRSSIPAVTHVDGSARPQLVSRGTNPLFWRLIDEFGALSGVPVLLNTSFNEREPIVCSPEDAIATFIRTEIDALAIGPYFLEKGPSA